jgi:Monooxygenase af470-like
MTQVYPGRYTADVDDELVVFLIGMRINKLWKIRTWLPVMLAMPKMLKAALGDPDSGLLGARTYFGPNPLVVQYWRSFEHLTKFARASDAPHLGAWRRFNKAIGSSGDVGIWHETYLVKPGAAECVYSNMPVFGLAGATKHVLVTGGRHTAAARIGRARPGASVAEPSTTEQALAAAAAPAHQS